MALTAFTSRLIADTGISTGDEGKGRLIPEVIRELQALHGRADIAGVVLKVNGGANSGHTVGGLKLNLLPGGVVERDVAVLALGAGVVADPRKIHWEARPVEVLGHAVYSRLLVDERAQVSDVSHRLLDLAWEDYRVNVLGQPPRGSTGRGITPAYADEVSQFQIYFADFLGAEETAFGAFSAKLDARIDRAERVIEHVCRVSPPRWNEFLEKLTAAEQRANAPAIERGVFDAAEFDFTRFAGYAPFRLNRAAVADAYWRAGSALRANIGDVRERILADLADGRFIVGEFGQAYWLDKRHGFPPNVTASHTYTPEFFQSAGIPAQPVHTIGVCKAYDTKVGTHTFLTQMDDAHPLAAHLKRLEYGTSTGRQRMVGWCDCVEKADALRYGGYNDLVLNKLDALSPAGDWHGDTLRVCTAYRDAAGALYHGVPRDDALRGALTPVYAELPGWREDIGTVRRFADLPPAARRYVAFIVKTIGELASRGAAGTAAGDGKAISYPNLRYIGVGPDPEQIIKDVPPAAELVKEA
ncbi:MAG: adenylosuccinate synthetase [Puniceicoccales bacterium]|jgi:adenylosuccinate synthase|nr:adenylosuccinate synthetase [Puniceicoccales bacterium]